MPTVRSMIASASLLLVAFSSQAFAQGRNPAPPTAVVANEAQKAAPAAKPFPTFNAVLGETQMAIPYFSNHCGPDEQFDFDRQLIQQVQSQLQADQTLLGLTINCQTLPRVRSGEITHNYSFAMYAGTDKSVSISRENAVQAICNTIDGGTLSKTSHADRAQELQDLSRTSTNEITAKIGSTPLACYLGLTFRIENHPTVSILGFTTVKGKLVFVTMTAIEGQPLPILLKDTIRLITQITTINDAR